MADHEIVKVPLMFQFDPGYKLLRGDAEFLGFEHRRCTMGVIRTHIYALMTLHTLKPHPYISLDMLH